MNLFFGLFDCVYGTDLLDLCERFWLGHKMIDCGINERDKINRSPVFPSDVMDSFDLRSLNVFVSLR